jgi:hypothetical protein
MYKPRSFHLENAIPINRKVLSIIHDPIITQEGGVKLSALFGWNDPELLAQLYIADVYECSHGIVQYEIAERVEVDGFPVKEDGFTYSTESFLKAWRAKSGFHEPDIVDYRAIIRDFDVVEMVDRGHIDEVWLFAFPYAGYYESIMAGPGAFWCNAPPLTLEEGCNRRFVIMGFNYERGVGEMLEDLGHRAESILTHVFRNQAADNLWERFTRYDQKYPGRAELGNIHYAPNSERDYDWGNPRKVPSKCDDWYQYPEFQNEFRLVNCAEWGAGDIRMHHMWWFQHLPHFVGSKDEVSNNWWEYVMDPNGVE